MKLYWAVKIRYLESPINGDGKWHTHTTRWYLSSKEAWAEAEEFQQYHNGNWYESSSSLIHKPADPEEHLMER